MGDAIVAVGAVLPAGRHWCRKRAGRTPALSLPSHALPGTLMPVKTMDLVRSLAGHATWVPVCAKHRGGCRAFVSVWPLVAGIRVELELRAYPGFWTSHYWRSPDDVCDLVERGDAMAGKWVTQALASRKKTTRIDAPGDPFLFKDRPALEEFMSELEGEAGQPRETSVLMIVNTEAGVRVGLKDDLMGGWLWRVESTVAKALNAIEKALQSGEAKFSGGAVRKPARGK